MGLRLNGMSKPSTPTSGKSEVYLDSTNKYLSQVLDNGVNHVLSDIGRQGNLLINGDFTFAQRQAPGTLTTYSNTSGRSYGADRWGLTNENASVQYIRTDSSGSPETSLAARYYGQFKKITSTGKVIVSQVIEGHEIMPFRGRTVRFQMRAKNSVGSHTLRMILLQLTSAGTLDAIPATFASAFGAAGTDPTWGTNLSAITPTLANANASISGSGLSCVLTSSWVRFGGTFLVPSNCKNIVAVICTNNQPVANDIFFVSEAGIYDGDEEREWFPLPLPDELARCQRFYCKTHNVDTIPTNAGLTTGEFRFASPVTASTAFAGVSWRFPVSMRAAATITGVNPVTASAATVRNVSQTSDCTVCAFAANGEQGCLISGTTPASTVLGTSVLGVHVTADAEL